MADKIKSEKRNPEGPVGRFIPCPANNDSHPEVLALEVKRSYCKRGKERFFTTCPICHTRIFLNNWKPGPRSRTLVQAEAEGLHPIGVMQERRDELLAELGLVAVPPQYGVSPQQQQQQWAGQVPIYAPRPQPQKKSKAPRRK